jgi:hypothetical protein
VVAAWTTVASAVRKAQERCAVEIDWLTRVSAVYPCPLAQEAIFKHPPIPSNHPQPGSMM